MSGVRQRRPKKRRTANNASPCEGEPRAATDRYLAKVDPAKRAPLERIRALAKTIAPEANEAIVYGMPTLTYGGKPLLGFDAHKNHIGIYPYSARVIEELEDELQGFEHSKGAIRVPLERPITKTLLRKVVMARMRMLRGTTKT